MKFKFNIKKIFAFLLIFEYFIGFMMILTGFYLFFVGHHNVDLAWNMLRISYFHGLDYDSFYDQPLFGNAISYDNAYVIGNLQQILGFFCSGIGFFLMTFAFSEILRKNHGFD